MMMKIFGLLAVNIQKIDIPVRFLILQVFLLTLFLIIAIF